MASAKVGSPMTSCHVPTGSWLVTIVERTPWRSWRTSSRSLLRLFRLQHLGSLPRRPCTPCASRIVNGVLSV